jgi:hypothetical protein
MSKESCDEVRSQLMALVAISDMLSIGVVAFIVDTASFLIDLYNQ